MPSRATATWTRSCPACRRCSPITRPRSIRAVRGTSACTWVPTERARPPCSSCRRAPSPYATFTPMARPAGRGSSRCPCPSDAASPGESTRNTSVRSADTVSAPSRHLYGYTSMAVAALQTQARDIEALKREVGVAAPAVEEHGQEVRRVGEVGLPAEEEERYHAGVADGLDERREVHGLEREPHADLAQVLLHRLREPHRALVARGPERRGEA